MVEVQERLDSEGKVITPLQFDFDESAKSALESGNTVAAVALLHSYRNPIHEEALRDHLLAMGYRHVSLSSQLAPLIKLLPRA